MRFFTLRKTVANGESVVWPEYRLPKEFGSWFTIYMRMRRWAENGVWARVLEALQTKLNMLLDVTALSLDSTSIKIHPDGTEALEKRTHKP